MAVYTVTIRDLLQNNFDLGLKDYPIYDESHRSTLNNMILNHYMMSEIGVETPALFKLYLNNTMNEIMPKYNLLYKAADELAKRESLLSDKDIHHVETVSSNGSANAIDKSKNSSSGDSSSKQLYLDTPQGQLKSLELDDASPYATNIELDKVNNTSSSSNEGNRSSTSSSTIVKDSHEYGNTGKSALDIYEQLRESYVAVDAAVIRELQPLFIGLY